MASLSMSAILVISVGELLWQISTPSVGGNDIQQMSLHGVLIAAVVVLWRALSAKDVQISAKDMQIAEMTRAVTVALTTSAAANGELRRIIEQSMSTKEQLSDSLSSLCTQLNMLCKHLNTSVHFDIQTKG